MKSYFTAYCSGATVLKEISYQVYLWTQISTSYCAGSFVGKGRPNLDRHLSPRARTEAGWLKLQDP